MRTSILLLVAVLVLSAAPARAFDHHRKGFVLGVGAGFAPLLHLQSPAEGALPVDETSTGIAAQFLAGYGWDDRNWLVSEGNVVSHRSETYDLGLVQGIQAIAWYHAYGPTPGWVSAIGAGRWLAQSQSYFRVAFTPQPTGPPIDDGWGAMVGVVREVHPRLLVMAYGLTGKSDTFRESHVSLMMQYLWD